MLKKFTRSLVLLTLTLTILFPIAAQAGIDKKLVEIDAAERARMEQERIAEQEAYEEAARLQAEQDRLAHERQEKMLTASGLREKEIDSRNALYNNGNCEDGEDCDNGGGCGFFCKLWKVITYPVRLVYRAVT